MNGTALVVGGLLGAAALIGSGTASASLITNNEPAKGAGMLPKRWTPPESAGPYLGEIAKAERTHGLPRDLLARLLYQESRYRQDIITGEVRSHAGAVGIAQIVPRWHPTVDPLNPVESIHYAARYLRKLYDQFGSWRLALAAYNWGPGNIGKYAAKPDQWPTETKNYVTQIMGDVGGVA